MHGFLHIFIGSALINSVIAAAVPSPATDLADSRFAVAPLQGSDSALETQASRRTARDEQPPELPEICADELTAERYEAQDWTQGSFKIVCEATNTSALLSDVNEIFKARADDFRGNARCGDGQNWDIINRLYAEHGSGSIRMCVLLLPPWMS